MKNLSKKVKLTRLNVLVKERNSGRLLLSEDYQIPTNTGIVLAVSPSVTKVKLQENIFYGKQAGVYVYLNGERYVLLSEREIFGIVDPTLTIDEFEIGETTDLIKLAEDMKKYYSLTGNDLNLDIKL